MGKLQSVWQYVRRHKYLVVSVIFLLIIGIFDENSLLKRVAHKREIASLREEIETYTKKYEEDTRRLKELDENPELIEKIARERYLMKNPDEDVFIFEE